MLTDSQGTQATFTGQLSAGDGPQTWTATVTREALLTLADGPLVASATYTTASTTAEPPTQLTGATLKIGKDLIAPQPPASTPAPGIYASAQSISLDHSDADVGTQVHYTTNGSDPTRFSQRATGPLWVTATQTVRALAVDSAGNPSEIAALAYRIEAPLAAPAAPVIVSPAAPAAAPAAIGPAVAPAQQSTAPLRVSALRVGSRRSARSIARSGLTVTFAAPRDVTKVRVRMLRGRQVIAIRRVATPTPKGYRVRLSAKGLRRLAAGAYTVEATPIGSGRAATTKVRFRIGR